MGQIRTFKDIMDRLNTNWKGYIHRYNVLIFLTLAAASADMLSTVYVMLIYGTQAEWHPTIRMVAMALGPVLGPIVGKLWQFAIIIALTVYLRSWALYIFLTVIVLYSWAAWYNIWGCHIYYPRLLQLFEYLPY